MPYFEPLAQMLILSTKGKIYCKFSGVNKKKCKKCLKFYYPIRVVPKGFEKGRCVDCYTDVLFEPATTTLDQF